MKNSQTLVVEASLMSQVRHHGKAEHSNNIQGGYTSLKFVSGSDFKLEVPTSAVQTFVKRHKETSNNNILVQQKNYKFASVSLSSEDVQQLRAVRNLLNKGSASYCSDVCPEVVFVEELQSNKPGNTGKQDQASQLYWTTEELRCRDGHTRWSGITSQIFNYLDFLSLGLSCCVCFYISQILL